MLEEHDESPVMIARVPFGRMVGANVISLASPVRKGGTVFPELVGTGTTWGVEASEETERVLEKSRVKRSTPAPEARGVMM